MAIPYSPMALRTRSKQRGVTLVEILASSLILAVSLLAAIQLFAFSMTLVEKTGDEGVAYNIARKTVENARQKGFPYQNLPDGTTTFYYDSLGNNESASPFAAAKFKVVQTVTSDLLGSTPTGPVPAPDSLRRVLVQVYRLPDNTLIQSSGTNLSRGGV